GDVEVVVQHPRLLRPEVRDGGELADARRDLGSQLLERADRSLVEVLLDLLGDRLADVRDALQAFPVERGDVRMMATDRPGGLLIGPHPEGVPAGDRQEVRVLLEEGFDRVVRPRHGAILDRPPDVAGGAQTSRSSHRRRAFWVCKRFSAWSHTTDCGPSM